MRLAMPSLPDKTPGEKVRVGFRLAPAIIADTVSGTPTWTSTPAGLTFGNLATTESAQTISADVSGGVDGQAYAISALVTLASGLVREPIAQIKVKAPAP